MLHIRALGQASSWRRTMGAVSSSKLRGRLQKFQALKRRARMRASVSQTHASETHGSALVPNMGALHPSSAWPQYAPSEPERLPHNRPRRPRATAGRRHRQHRLADRQRVLQCAAYGGFRCSSTSRHGVRYPNSREGSRAKCVGLARGSEMRRDVLAWFGASVSNYTKGLVKEGVSHGGRK